MRSSADTDEVPSGDNRARSVLASRLFASIFLSFFGLGALITGTLIWDVLKRAEDEVAREMRLVERAFHDPIADQLWAYDQEELGAILNALVRLSAVEGITIDDPHSGRRLAMHGLVDHSADGDFAIHRFGVFYLPQGSNRPRLIGNAVLYTPADLALRRSWPSVALILSAAAIKVLLLWFLFRFFARRQLIQPLARLTAAVDAVDPATGSAGPVRAVSAEDGELARLQGAFNNLLARLKLADAVRAEYERDLVSSRDRLEDAVKERTRALEAARAQAEEANLAKSRFLAMMSHELRTPLNSILGFSRLMRDEIFGSMNNPKYREYTEDIQNSAQHLLEVISDILDISKIEAGEIQLDSAIVDIRSVADAAARLVKPRLNAKQQTLDIDIPERLPHLKADERAIRQILVNLLSNSNKFTPAGGSVRLRAQLDKHGGIVLSVEDTGIGISPEDIPVVFEAFGQAHSNSRVVHEGTGLGLTLSKQLVELHHGVLTLESEVGRGTTVTMSFPPERSIPSG